MAAAPVDGVATEATSASAAAASSPPPTADLEKGTPAWRPDPTPPPPTGAADEGSSVVRAVVQRWRREDLIAKSGLLLRALAALFTLIAALVLGSNKHGDWKDFSLYQEYRYLLAIVLLSFLYSAGQVALQVNRFSGGKDLVPKQYAGFVDFAGDQVAAYLLISALSAASPITNHMREGADNIFTDASAASISMAFFAFVALALSALLSGFKASRQTYI